MGARVNRVIARSRATAGDTALFAHGHLLRVFAARWIGLPAGGGQHFLLNPGTLSVLGYYHEIAAVRIWNERGRVIRTDQKAGPRSYCRAL